MHPPHAITQTNFSTRSCNCIIVVVAVAVDDDDDGGGGGKIQTNCRHADLETNTTLYCCRSFVGIRDARVDRVRSTSGLRNGLLINEISSPRSRRKKLHVINSLTCDTHLSSLWLSSKLIIFKKTF